MKRVTIISPYDMTSRNILDSSLIELIEAKSDVSVSFVSPNENDRCRLNASGTKISNWQPCYRPFKKKFYQNLNNFEKIRFVIQDIFFSIGFFLHLSTVYRFNSISKFKGFEERLNQSANKRWEAFREGLPTQKFLGFPFCQNRIFLKKLTTVLYFRWQRHDAVSRMFDKTKPHCIVLGHVQNHFITPYVIEAKIRNIPIIGIIGSWDQPTTKGPISPYLTELLAQNQQVKRELIKFHDIEEKLITVVGWPQMDQYFKHNTCYTKSSFFKKIGIPASSKLILFGAYSHRLGEHEPKICELIATNIEKNHFGDGVYLYVRPHPMDTNWEERLGYLRNYKNVMVVAPVAGDFKFLGELLRWSNVVISSAGTISLDAIAFNTAAIALSFEEDNVPFFDMAARRYDMEHYKNVIEKNIIEIVNDSMQLDNSIKKYIGNPKTGSRKRLLFCEDFFAPFDGHSTERISKIIYNSIARQKPHD